MTTYQEFQEGENVGSFEKAIFLAYQIADKENRSKLCYAFPKLFSSYNHTPNLHLIEVNYMPPTNTLGARVRLKSHRFDSKKVISFNQELNSIADMAINELTRMGFEIHSKCETKEGYGILCSTFEEF